MVDLAKIEGIFRNLDQYMAVLREIAQLSEAELSADLATLGGAKYYLQVSVECCIDVAHHIIARQNWRAPQNYADSFVVLAENDVISENFLDTTRRMVGMRNRLVHLYWEIDVEVVHQVLQYNLDDCEQFKAYIYRYLAQIGVIQTD